MLRWIRVHIRHSGGDLLVVDPVLVAFDIFYRSSFLFGKGYVGNMIQALKYHIVPILVVCHKIIPLIVEDHLIRAYTLLRGFVEFPVDSVFVVVVADLYLFFDCFIN